MSIELDTKILYYNYFFLSMGLANPELGFHIVEYISYDHLSIIYLFRHINDEFDIKKLFFPIDYALFFKSYLNALTKFILNKNEDININDEAALSSMTETLENVREEIKRGRYKHDPLASCITKMMSLSL